MVPLFHQRPGDFLICSFWVPSSVLGAREASGRKRKRLPSSGMQPCLGSKTAQTNPTASPAVKGRS